MSGIDWNNTTLTAQKHAVVLPFTDEQLRQAEEDRRADREAIERWNALTPERRAEWTRQRDERLAREKAERTCTHCGCDPDEHGGY